MAGGCVVPPAGELGELRRILGELERRVRILEAPTGSQTAETLVTLKALVEDLVDTVNSLAASGVTWAGPVSTGGNVTASGTVTGAAGINSVGAFNLDVSTLPGTRRGAWWHQSGAAGYAPSTKTRKQRIRKAELSAEQFMVVAPKVFQYKAQADIRDNPENPHYDPSYVVPDEIGLIAEDLVEAGLGAFVFRDENGEPAGIDYAMFGAICSLVLGQAAYRAATA